MGQTYKAFISYSHKDEAFARWLHRQIEGWRVPRDLVGRETAHGKVPASIRPVFRDRDDFSGGSSLRQATLNALEASEALIVICSPDAARSLYVDEEIRLFKMLGRSQRVIAIIAAGDPASDTCFPSWLRREPDAAGNATGEAVEPIAADARDVGDGHRRAAAKVVAGLLGVPFDEIMRRAERDRRARNALFAGAGFGAFVFATAFSSYALYQSYQAGVAIEKSVFSIGGLIHVTEALPESDEVAAIRREMLREQCDLMEGLAGEQAAIGMREASICFYERTIVSSSERPPEELLAILCPWRDQLSSVVLPKPKPGYEESEALVHALDRTYRRIADHPDAAGKCHPDARAKLPDHLALLLEQLGSLGAKRPDVLSLRTAHEWATWQLVQSREATLDWSGSEAAMQLAVELRSLQMKEPSAESLNPAAYEYGVYVRRLSWLKNTHLRNPGAAEEFGRRAVDHWTGLAKEFPKRVDVGYQTVVAFEVHAEALEALGRREEAVERLSAAQARAAAILVEIEGGNDTAWKPDVEKELRFVSDRLAQLKAG